VTERQRGIAYGLGAYVLWGLLTLYWHELSGLDAGELIGQRIVWSSVVLAAVISIRGSWDRLRPLLLEPLLLARVGGAAVLLTINWGSYVWAVTHGNVIETALGYFIAPLGTVVVGVVVLHEHLRPAQRTGLLLAGAAVVVLTVGYGRPPILALAIAASWTGYGLLKKLVPLGPLESLAGETFLLVPLALLVIAVQESRPAAIGAVASHWQLALLAVSGVATVIPLLMFAAATPRIPLSTLGPLQYAVPTINFLLGVTVYDESLPLWRLAGFALVWVGLGWNTADSLRTARGQRSGRGPLKNGAEVPTVS
jgi:chloramphenicol-sensitive protein RarD